MKKVCIPDITSLSDLDSSDSFGVPKHRSGGSPRGHQVG